MQRYVYFYIPFISLKVFNMLQYVPNSNRFVIVTIDYIIIIANTTYRHH